MARSPALVALLAGVLFCGACSHSIVSSNSIADKAGPSDVEQIYGLFLDVFNRDAEVPLNISMVGNAPTPEQIEQFSRCATSKGTTGTSWVQPSQINDMTSAIGKSPNVRLVNPKDWKPTDPGDLIAQGQSVESAVKSGFAKGLLTMTAVTFSTTHETAALTYSFVCGALCGSGGTVIFEKTNGNWTLDRNECGSWIS